MRFKVPSNLSDSGISLPHPCVSRECRENHPSQCSCKGRRGREEDRRLFQPQEQQPEQGPSLQPQNSPGLCAGHSTNTRYKPTRAAPQPHRGLADPPLLATMAGPRLFSWQKSDVAAPDVSQPCARCQMPAGKARARAGSPDLLTVRANPWQSRNTPEPTPPSHLAGLSSGTPIRSRPSLV